MSKFRVDVIGRLSPRDDRMEFKDYIATLVIPDNIFYIVEKRRSIFSGFENVEEAETVRTCFFWTKEIIVKSRRYKFLKADTITIDRQVYIIKVYRDD